LYNVSSSIPFHTGIIDLKTVRATPDLEEALAALVQKKSKYKHYQRDLKQVEFYMVPDNSAAVSKRLDEIRLKQPKFFCLNDDMNKTSEPSVETLKVLEEFFEAYYPVKSPFELPDGQSNIWLSIEEYRKRGLINRGKTCGSNVGGFQRSNVWHSLKWMFYALLFVSVALCCYIISPPIVQRLLKRIVRILQDQTSRQHHRQN